MGCHKLESHCMNSSSPLSDTMYAKDNRPESPVREKDQQMLYFHKPQMPKSVISHIVDKVCVRDKTFQEFRERSKSEGRIKDCPIRGKSKSGTNYYFRYINFNNVNSCYNYFIVVSEECVKNTRACSLYQMIDIRDLQYPVAQSTSNIHEKVYLCTLYL